MSSTETTETTTQETRMTGRVKWFNNTSGYGFITVTDGSQSGNDIFVHHSAIIVKNEQYKYLVQGEYVMFSLANTTNAKHSVQAVNVNGINGGKLMCETRREFKESRDEYNLDKETSEPVKKPRSKQHQKQTQTSAPRQKQSQPQKKTSTESWTYANKTSDKGSKAVKEK
jgi:CspA family cold shock protein